MGGCASTNIISWCSQHIKCNCSMNSEGLPMPGEGGNAKGLKHRIRPPLNDDEHLPSEIEKAVFLYDTPYNIIPSLFRQRIAWGHAIAITGQRPKGEENLDGFIAEGKDSFGFSTQFNNWTDLQIQRSYPRMIVRASLLWSYLPEFLTFLGVPESQWKYFPQKKQRFSSFDALQEHQKAGIIRIYGELHEAMGLQQDIHIVYPDSQN